MHRFLLSIMTALSLSYAAAEQTDALRIQEIEAIAIKSYIYGYPLVTMEMTKNVSTNVEIPGAGSAPMGQFFNMAEFPDPATRTVTTPNADTLYSSAWIDLSKEPYILHVPEESDRYYLMQMLDAWTNVFANPGTRTTGSKAADFAITGPGWKGILPTSVKEFKSPTNLVWIIGRTYSTGTKEDIEAVNKIQSQYRLTPLSAYNSSYRPPKGRIDPAVDMKTPVRDQVHRLTAPAFFNILAASMKNNPPAPEDSEIIAEMAKIGIVPGKPFDASKLDPNMLASIPAKALKAIQDHEKEGGKIINGWRTLENTGRFGKDYLQRAYVTLVGLGANLPEDAVYPMARVDDLGRPLSGAYRYTLHFPKDKLPPVNAFWSLTLYDDQYFFSANPMNRYSLGSKDPLKLNPDGSLDLFIQSESPGKEKESNWLPAPKGTFILVLRCYWPKNAVLKRTWQPPGIHRID